MKPIKKILLLFPIMVSIVAFADSGLEGPTLGPINDAETHALVTSSASTRPFIGAPAGLNQPYLLEEGTAQGNLNSANVQIAKTTKQCQSGFKPIASVSIIKTADSKICTIKALHPSEAYVMKNTADSGYKVFVTKASAEYASCMGGSTAWLKLHWTVFCYNNINIG